MARDNAALRDPVACEPARQTRIRFVPEKRQSQQDRILALLQSKEWVTLPEILNLRIASFTRRITSLRRAGWVIETEVTQVGRERHSRYKLISGPA